MFVVAWLKAKLIGKKGPVHDIRFSAWLVALLPASVLEDEGRGMQFEKRE